MSSREGPPKTILHAFHGAVLEVRDITVIYEDLDQGLAVKIMMKSCQKSLRDLVLLMRRSCEDPAMHPPNEVLAWRSCRCHVSEVLVWKLFWDALGRFLLQDLPLPQQVLFWRSCEILWEVLVKIVVRVFYHFPLVISHVPIEHHPTNKGIWSIMATIRWCPIFPKWDI